MLGRLSLKSSREPYNVKIVSVDINTYTEFSEMIVYNIRNLISTLEQIKVLNNTYDKWITTFKSINKFISDMFRLYWKYRYLLTCQPYNSMDDYGIAVVILKPELFTGTL